MKIVTVSFNETGPPAVHTAIPWLYWQFFFFLNKRSVSKFYDPLRSSDLTLQDYLLWCVLITKLYKNNPHSLGDLKVNMQCQFINSDMERYKRS